MQDALRIGDFDPFLLEAFPDGEKDVALDVLHAVVRVGDPEARLQLDPAVTELEQQAFRRGILEHPLRLPGSLQAERNRPLKIRAIVDTHGDLEPGPAMGVSPVFHALRDQRLVRDAAQPSAQIWMAEAVHFQDVSKRVSLLLAGRQKRFHGRTIRSAREIAQGHLNIVGEVAGQVLGSDRGEVGRRMVGMVQPRRRVEHQTAETLAGHLEAGAELPAALQAASAAWENDALQQGTRKLAESIQRGELPGDDAPITASFPPLLRWAIWHGEETVGRAPALRMAADFYTETSQRRVQRLHVIAPIVTCTVIGGSITLLYGLALFVPVAQMIQGLAG